MASAWGNSWGKSWGNSWGSIAVARRGGGRGVSVAGKQMHIPIREDDEEDVVLAVLMAVNAFYWGGNDDSKLH